MAIQLIPHQARPHAADYALELLADEYATTLGRSAVRALSSIGSRYTSEASAMEWAFLHLTELWLGLAYQQECR
jgi:hypothetical protein